MLARWRLLSASAGAAGCALLAYNAGGSVASEAKAEASEGSSKPALDPNAWLSFPVTGGGASIAA